MRFSTRSIHAGQDADPACTLYHQQLLEEKRWPCGVCAKVCPTGEDRLLYGSTKVGLYLRERQAIRKDPDSSRFRPLMASVHSWVAWRRRLLAAHTERAEAVGRRLFKHRSHSYFFF